MTEWCAQNGTSKTNTSGRYCINTYPSAKENTFKSATFVGFEEEKELTYFMLACPHLKYT